MLEVQIFLFVLNLWASCDISKRLYQMEVEFRFGTYEGDWLPDDPRKSENSKWLDYCKFGGIDDK